MKHYKKIPEEKCDSVSQLLTITLMVKIPRMVKRPYISDNAGLELGFFLCNAQCSG